MSDSPSRRQVLCGLAVALVAPGVMLAACSTDSDGGGRPSGGAVKPGGVLAKVGDVPVGGGVLVDAGGRKLLLVQPTAGTIKAFDPACPHQGFTVDPPAGGTVVCPGHGSTFNAASGAVTKGPATSGLKPVPVKVSGGNVVAA